ncbi:hypothetical protein [Paracidobacterium acidisoli]|uniref:hypothetical protein n=1 Tax=Paracidobacterium acidisoli TaxID=2303751 RepID=UPI0011C12BA6|nr:hypothetical protein [Paracidobacterium acidisoli]MBT9332578.1 hypothetical protein [Paracidobacterium acidisoli]
MAKVKKGSSEDPSIKTRIQSRWARFISYLKHKMNEKFAKTEQESSADKSARITANATKMDGDLHSHFGDYQSGDDLHLEKST